MSDKPVVQHELAKMLAGLLHVPPTPEASLLFIQAFMKTMVREWDGIDKFRYVLEVELTVTNTRSEDAPKLTFNDSLLQIGQVPLVGPLLCQRVYSLLEGRGLLGRGGGSIEFYSPHYCLEP